MRCVPSSLASKSQIYSSAGALFLLIKGQFFFFSYPEWYIYGGIGLTVAVIALVNILALSNVGAQLPGDVIGIDINYNFQRSYVWIRVCKFLWPFVIIICAIRAALMIVELQRGFVTKPYMDYVAFTYSSCSHDRKDNIIWECNHGGQIWSSNAEYAANASFPVGFCSAGFNSLYTAFIVSLLVDLAFQVRSRPDHKPRKINPCRAAITFSLFQMYMFFMTWRYQRRLERYELVKTSGGE